MSEKNSKYWEQRALERYKGTELQTHKTSLQIKKMYKQALKNIRNEINSIWKNYAKNNEISISKLKKILTKKETDKLWINFKKKRYEKYIKENYKYRLTKAEQIQAQLYFQMKELFPKELKLHKKLYKNIIYENYYKAVFDVQNGLGFSFDFSKIDKNLIEVLLEEKWSDKNYSQRLYDNVENFSNKISQIVGGGLMSGTSISLMSKQIRDVFEIQQYFSERLIRTEANYFYNQADLLSSKELGIEKYVFLATLDNRTSEICQEHDGKTFLYKNIKIGENYPPLHPNCRSTTRAYISEEIEKKLQRRARNPETGKNEIVTNMNYSQWIKKYKISY